MDLEPLTTTKQGVLGSRQSGWHGALSKEYAIAIGLTLVVTAASLAFEPVAGHFAVSSLYLLLVVVAGLKLRQGPVLVVAASSALAWYTVFIPPRFAFHIGTMDDALIFTTFFAVAMAMGQLTSRLRLKEMTERMRERRTAALYDLVQQAGLAPDLDSGLRAAIRVTETLFGVRAALLPRDSDHTLSGIAHAASSFALDATEFSVATTAFGRRAPAGRFTDTFPNAKALHLPLQARAAVVGVLSILPPPGGALDASERELLEAFALLIGTIWEKEHLLQALKHAEILEASERLQRALLQSVSHELKTPLAALQTGFDALAKETANGPRSRATSGEVHQALRRLRRVINNLLDMTRIESGVIHPKLDWCDVGELIEAAKDLAADGLTVHEVEVLVDQSLPMVRLDQALLEQCVCNLLLNAASNSAPGTEIEINARVADDRLVIAVRDEGKGITAAELPHIFETFYRGAQASPGGTGLGLAIVDGFTRALGGSVTAANRQPHGAEFVITIPAETLRPDVMEKLA